MQNGFIDFQKNRQEYQKQRGLPDRDLSNAEMESQIQSRHVEDEFIMVESNINKFRKRKS